MGQISIPGTSVVLDNPRAVDQSTVVFPDCGDAAAIAAGNYLPNVPSRAGKKWEVFPLAGIKASWGGALTYPGPAVPKPGSFDPTPPTAPPIAVNQDPPVPNKGVPMSVTKNPDGSTATAHGTIAGTTVTFNSPA
jgi:hypothetical protein